MCVCGGGGGRDFDVFDAVAFSAVLDGRTHRYIMEGLAARRASLVSDQLISPQPESPSKAAACAFFQRSPHRFFRYHRYVGIM